VNSVNRRGQRHDRYEGSYTVLKQKVQGVKPPMYGTHDVRRMEVNILGEYITPNSKHETKMLFITVDMLLLRRTQEAQSVHHRILHVP